MAPRILVVEDTPGVARLLEVTLGAAGFEVGAVETWTETGARFDDRAPIDLVVFGFFLPNGPDGDALASCRAVKARRPGTPLVVLAPDGRAATRAACLEAGADAFLRRPLDPVELKAVVSRLVPEHGGSPEPASRVREPRGLGTGPGLRHDATACEHHVIGWPAGFCTRCGRADFRALCELEQRSQECSDCIHQATCVRAGRPRRDAPAGGRQVRLPRSIGAAR